MGRLAVAACPRLLARDEPLEREDDEHYNNRMTSMDVMWSASDSRNDDEKTIEFVDMTIAGV